MGSPNVSDQHIENFWQSKDWTIPPGDPEEMAAAAAGIQRGLDDFAAGRYKSVKEVFAAHKSSFDVLGIKISLTREEIIEAIHEGRGNDRW